MRKYFVMFLAITIEFALLLVVVALLLVGAAGIVLPIIPGIAFIGLGIALYLATLKHQRSGMMPHIHRVVLKIKSFFKK